MQFKTTDCYWKGYIHDIHVVQTDDCMHGFDTNVKWYSDTHAQPCNIHKCMLHAQGKGQGVHVYLLLYPN